MIWHTLKICIPLWILWLIIFYALGGCAQYGDGEIQETILLPEAHGPDQWNKYREGWKLE